ncbi:thioredoxin family protein [Natronolimnobius baerhuensis]|uniref:Thiol reductase thioredoxin n=1 Tax=Natronolimnobius baerhuensis TaxID=253108 RepID=A0A202ECD6_9EURY|nr:thioredoxin family protein [Natronolimnobius baerhuensis]OVE85926.1 thiol reductase thioredoxin [Natronolimnobius baerhuensis]
MTDPPRPVHLEDDADLEAFIDTHDVALIECYTSGCSMCQAMEPVLGNVARETGIPIGLVNPGDDLALLERFDIRSVPALFLFRDGTQIAQIAEGFLGGDEVVSFLETHVPGAVASE